MCWKRIEFELDDHYDFDAFGTGIRCCSLFCRFIRRSSCICVAFVFGFFFIAQIRRYLMDISHQYVLSIINRYLVCKWDIFKDLLSRCCDCCCVHVGSLSCVYRLCVYQMASVSYFTSKWIRFCFVCYTRTDVHHNRRSGSGTIYNELFWRDTHTHREQNPHICSKTVYFNVWMHFEHVNITCRGISACTHHPIQIIVNFFF